MKETENERIFLAEENNLINDLVSPKQYYGIAIHTAQSTIGDHETQVFMIDDWHKKRGENAGWKDPWRGIFYAIVIERDGRIYITHHLRNGTEQVGSSGLKGHHGFTSDNKFHINKDFIHICIAGHGEIQEMSNAQLSSLKKVIYCLSKNNPDIKIGFIFPHALFSAEKTCPGYFVYKHFQALFRELEKGKE